MSFQLVTSDMRSGYVTLINAVRHSHNRVKPRGKATLEIPDVLIELTDPTRAIPYDVGRKLHMPIASAEFIQLVGGYSDVEQLASISPVFNEFTNRGRLRGAYGPRLHCQWDHLLERLTVDPDTRQAVAILWYPSELMNTSSRDVPCTISLSYTIRDGALHARTHMRSNDLWLGTPYDFAQFTALQRTLAWVLKIPVGTYTHFVNSLHLYEQHLDAAANVKLKMVGKHHDYMPPITFTESEGASVQTRWAIAQARARRIGMGISELGEYNEHFDRLVNHASTLPICHRCRYAYDPDPERDSHNLCRECNA